MSQPIGCIFTVIIAIAIFLAFSNVHFLSQLEVKDEPYDKVTTIDSFHRENSRQIEFEQPRVLELLNETSRKVEFEDSFQNIVINPHHEENQSIRSNSTGYRHGTIKGSWLDPHKSSKDAIIINTTKIVGFISSHYVKIAVRWYNRLEILGYRNHYIVCTDSESYDILRNQPIAYRVEVSYLPPMKLQFTKLRYGKKQRQRVIMLFAHRWVYALEQLKIGYHILMTDVDNIFSSYYDMKNLELSHFDVYHAFETKHPEDVFRYQGFVFCGGMGWFRSSPSTIRYVQAIVNQCGDACDDQILLNRLVAYKYQVQWDRNRTEHSEVTVHTDDTNVTLDRLGNHFHRLVGLPVKGFTGYSKATGVRIQVWDRDFAYRGKVDPSVCPKSNWVSMPFVTVLTRGQTANAKLSMYDVWDSHCPNDYSNRTQQKDYGWHILTN